ncbi:hypothetical protein Tco_0267315 [Tanacetum coccineum]
MISPMFNPQGNSFFPEELLPDLDKKRGSISFLPKPFRLEDAYEITWDGNHEVLIKKHMLIEDSGNGKNKTLCPSMVPISEKKLWDSFHQGIAQSIEGNVIALNTNSEEAIKHSQR